MIRIFLYLLTCICLSNACAYTIDRSHVVLFDKDEAQLTEVQRVALLQFLDSCELHLDHHFNIEGHTDSDGSYQYNLDLSDRRAVTISDWLTANRIAERHISKAVYSEVRPIASNAYDTGMAQNRRVTIHFTAEYYENLSEVTAYLNETEDYVSTIDNSKDQLVVSPQGVRVSVPAGCFVDVEGNEVTDVDLEIVEALSLEEFIANGLETKTEDGLLVSGGMIRLTATTSDGRPVDLRADGALTVSIPDAEPQDGMEVFGTSDSGQTWQRQGSLLSAKDGMAPRPKAPGRHYTNFVGSGFRVDNTKRPLYPMEPREPKPPVEPIAEDFASRLTLIEKLEARKIRAREARQYTQAQEIYARNLIAYDGKMHAYEERCAGYTDELNNYFLQLPLWDIEVARQEAYHKEVTVPAERAAFDKKNEALEYNYQVALSRWREKAKVWDDQYALALERLGLPPGDDINRYVFRATNMGWVNMDRFMKMAPNQKHQIIAKTQHRIGPMQKVFVVLNNGRSLLNLRPGENKYLLSGFPKTEQAELVAYTVYDGRLHIYTEPFVGKKSFALNYRPSSVAELKTILESKSGALGYL